MNPLPNAEQAIIDISKLKDYCLNPHHPVGKHKAHTFKSELGIEQKDAELLKSHILFAIPNSRAEIHSKDKYGTRYTVDVKIRILDMQKTLTTGWIIRSEERFPRLITCYLKS